MPGVRFRAPDVDSTRRMSPSICRGTRTESTVRALGGDFVKILADPTLGVQRTRRERQSTVTTIEPSEQSARRSPSIDRPMTQSTLIARFTAAVGPLVSRRSAFTTIREIRARRANSLPRFTSAICPLYPRLSLSLFFLYTLSSRIYRKWTVSISVRTMST